MTRLGRSHTPKMNVFCVHVTASRGTYGSPGIHFGRQRTERSNAVIEPQSRLVTVGLRQNSPGNFTVRGTLATYSP